MQFLRVKTKNICLNHRLGMILGNVGLIFQGVLKKSRGFPSLNRRHLSEPTSWLIVHALEMKLFVVQNKHQASPGVAWVRWKITTRCLPETKSLPLKIDPLEKEIPIENPPFLGANMLVLGCFREWKSRSTFPSKMGINSTEKNIIWLSHTWSQQCTEPSSAHFLHKAFTLRDQLT